MPGIELDSVSCVQKAQFNPASLTSTYQPINGANTQTTSTNIGFSDSVKIFQMYNPSTTISIDISFDGVTDHAFLPPMATLIVDWQASHADNLNSGNKYGMQGQIIYGKTAAHPTYIQMIGYR
jgi:hypothetical protein